MFVQCHLCEDHMGVRDSHAAKYGFDLHFRLKNPWESSGRVLGSACEWDLYGHALPVLFASEEIHLDKGEILLSKLSAKVRGKSGGDRDRREEREGSGYSSKGKGDGD